jgi:hypothetical protein
MTMFDFIFVGAAFVSLFLLIAIVVEGSRRRFGNAWKISVFLAVGIAIYLSIVVAVSLLTPQRALALHEDMCSDDWCIAVDDVARADAENVRLYTISLRLTSRALRVTQRELGLTVYLLDRQGRRHDPLPDKAAVPFDTRLTPGESVMAVRTFALEGETDPAGLVLTREGFYRFPGIFIIGDESSLFHKSLLVPLPR